MRIIQCSHDEAVQFTRKLLLERIFPDAFVLSVYTVEELQAACAKSSFDIVIIGQSLTDREKQVVDETVHLHCGQAKVVEMYNRFPVTHADMKWNTAEPLEAFGHAIKAMNNPA